MDFRSERFDFDLRGDAKDLSWGALLGDVSVGGTFLNPELDYLGAEFVFQISFAALLASASGALVALPFFELGGGEDYACSEIAEYAAQ